jgi:XTP/dITP diphosphohydrolase
VVTRLVLASANVDKVGEIVAIVGTALPGVELLPRPPDLSDVVENGATLLDNARLKAVAVATATGEAALADDTGLEVEALGGAPGVLTARFSGEAATAATNVARLLEEMEGIRNRRATFRTVVLVHWPDGREVSAEGAAAGHIATAIQGTGGFGYDPVFLPTDGRGQSYAELDPAEKNRLSHRSRALHALAATLRSTSP